MAGKKEQHRQSAVSLRSGRIVSLRIMLIALLTASVPFVPAGVRADTTATVFASNHGAMRVPTAGNLEISYTFAGFGLTGVASRHIDLASGAYVENLSAGPVSLGSGYDGKAPWMKDFSGAYTLEEGGDRVELAVNQAYRYANLWWRPDRGGAGVTYVRHGSDGDATGDHVVITPAGGKRFDAWFDADSHLLSTVREVQGFISTETRYSDYALINGMMVPRKTVIDQGAGPSSFVTLTLEHVSARPRRPRSSYSCPSRQPHDASIEGGRADSTIDFQLLNNHIYVQARVDGKGPFTFIVDTGGHLALSPHLVATLGAAAAGSAPVSGEGEKTATTGFAHVQEIALGTVRLHDQTAFVTEVYDTAVEGIPVDGMLGFELFRRFGVQIDYARKQLVVFDPGRPASRDLGVMIPFKFYDHLPDVTGMIDGQPARFDIDTGSRSELDVTAPFVQRTGLHAKFPDAIEAITGWGVGGPVSSRVVRLRTLKLGEVPIADVIAELSDAAHGSGSDSNYDGNIGSGLLKRFLVTFDYAHARLYLKRVQPAPPDIATFDRSGMWINASADGYVITALDRDGPAERAGLAAGNVITAIDSRPTQMTELSKVRQQLRTLPPGTVVRLEIRGDPAPKMVSLTLRDLVSGPDRVPAR